VVLGGLDVSREYTVDAEDPSATTLEAILSLSFAIFRYDDPETNVRATLSLFPGLTEWGRLRTHFETDARRELVKDLFFELSGYVDSDSDPLVEEDEEVSKSDWGVITSLGWTF
jgi:hypothetical protein